MCTLIIVLLTVLFWKPVKRLLYGPDLNHRRPKKGTAMCPFHFFTGGPGTATAELLEILNEPHAAPANKPGLGWEERYVGGNIAAETVLVEKAMKDIHQVQKNNKGANGSPCFFRAFHAKILAGIRNAKLRISPTIPQELQVGFLQPGAEYDTDLRFSNANGGIKPDNGHDLRGIALRVDTGGGVTHDFLATNGKVSHARDFVQFIAFALAVSGSKILLPFRLIWAVGLFEALRMLKTASGQASHPVTSLSTETYFSRAPYAFGNYAVKFQLTPHSSAGLGVAATGGQFLHTDLVERLKHGPVVFNLQVQYFLNEEETPIEDGSVEWNSPLLTIAQLVIPQQNLEAPVAAAANQAVEDFEFNPWNVSNGFRPLGSLNRARRFVYKASVELRKGQKMKCPLGLGSGR